MRYFTSIIMRLALLALLLAAASLRMGATAYELEDSRPFTVVIDAGHGGRDVGCEGKKGREKDITLAVALLLGQKVEQAYGNQIRVVLTRSDDTYLTLQERADVANGEQGDLFISIHVNSVDRRTRGRDKLAGASVYTCGLHKSEANLQVAMQENAVMELEPDFTATYQGFDPASDESYIIFELSQHSHMMQSLEFASLAQKQLVATAHRADRDVRQAGFWVLWATSMPSVLVELDFICNPEQENFLLSDLGQELCAQALLEALLIYHPVQQ